ncbi:hypothetical protein [Chitinibacter sp. ZOR0017]|uniref:hypothetical protein n=1 Tax=Chitinibacter sp. ZOR0017 TaxID=1339254 RepID=UPI0012E00004|nr:hypothetical protein [Chitinibacter sp. ZOR0017]
MRLKLFCIKPSVHIAFAIMPGFLLSACASTNQLTPEKTKSLERKTPQFECITINDQTKRTTEISHRIGWLPSIRKHMGSDVKFAVDAQLNRHCELTEIKMIQSTGNNELDKSIMKDLREVRLPIQDSNKETENIKIRFSEGP